MNSMFSITGQVVNTFEAPGRAANEKAGTEAQEAKPKVQILGEMPVPGGQKRVELVTLTCEDQRVYDGLKGQTVSVPLGIFSPAKGQIIYFIPKGSLPVVLCEAPPPSKPRSAATFPPGFDPNDPKRAA
jgi:hypothetical protein